MSDWVSTHSTRMINVSRHLQIIHKQKEGLIKIAVFINNNHNNNKASKFSLYTIQSIDKISLSIKTLYNC